MVYGKLLLRKGATIIQILSDIRKIEMKQNFLILSGH